MSALAVMMPFVIPEGRWGRTWRCVECGAVLNAVGHALCAGCPYCGAAMGKAQPIAARYVVVSRPPWWAFWRAPLHRLEVLGELTPRALRRAP